MAITRIYKTNRYSRHTYGDDGLYGKRNILSVSFVASELKRPQVANAVALLAATTLNTSAVTTLIVNAQPDITRNISVTLGGTAASIGSGNVVITGHNHEGALITDTIAIAATTAATYNGTKAFASVDSVTFPATLGAGANASVGYGGRLGIKLRNLASMPVMVLTRTSAGVEALAAPSSSNFDATLVENNTVVPATTPDGTIEMRVYVLDYKWALNPTNATPDYGV